MDDFAIPRRYAAARARLGFQNDDLAAGQGEGTRDRKSDYAGSDDGYSILSLIDGPRRRLRRS
jgi:hypothetical protein